MTHHQKAADGNAKLLRGLRGHLPQPACYDDWHYRTQLNQARAVTFGIEHFRAQAPYCRGTIVWQLNDCWPATSWSAIDGDARRKPLWYALRRVYADRLLTVQGDSLAVVNDSDRPWSGELSLTRRRLDGELLAAATVEVAAPARGVLRVPIPDELRRPADPAEELLVATLGELRAVSFFGEDTEVSYPPADYEARAEPVPGGYRVTVTARTVLRDLALFPDRLDPRAAVDDMLLTLLPGERAVFQVSTAERLDPAELLRAPVLRCVNERRPAR